MLAAPTPQRHHRAPKSARPSPRVANSAVHQAVLSTRLTPRDRWIISMLWEHRVLTSEQITSVAFPSYRSGRQRLRELYLWGVIDRFQPFTPVGSAPMHYVLAPAGAAALASQHGLEVKDLGYRHDRAVGIAHSLRLAHTVGVNEWFVGLIGDALRLGEFAVDAWWSEVRCTRLFGDLTRPDGYGRLVRGAVHTEFFLEFDLGTEPLTKVVGKLVGYSALAESTGISTPLLFWFPIARREANARKQLLAAWRGLDNPDAVPVSTAAANLLDPSDEPSPANAVWLSLDNRSARRSALHDVLPMCPQSAASSSDSPTVLPPPDPMPPPASRPGGGSR
ncbi:replication-relaxation family protein [Lentzea sp. NPDC058436]|uniref:replication-relaxation family protein n=1 Tax=Lentzea sp. NPDC058436 TaxID=3346499 RepID=UPI003667640A